MAKKASASQKKVKAAFHEVKQNPPKVLAKTKKKSGAKQANKQRVAIALNKARKAGANIPMPTRDEYLNRMKERSGNA